MCFPFLECPTFAFLVRVNLETLRHYFLMLLLNHFTCWSRLSHWMGQSTKGKSVTYILGFSQRNQDGQPGENSYKLSPEVLLWIEVSHLLEQKSPTQGRCISFLVVTRFGPGKSGCLRSCSVRSNYLSWLTTKGRRRLDTLSSDDVDLNTHLPAHVCLQVHVPPARER